MSLQNAPLAASFDRFRLKNPKVFPLDFSSIFKERFYSYSVSESLSWLPTEEVPTYLMEAEPVQAKYYGEGCYIVKLQEIFEAPIKASKGNEHRPQGQHFKLISGQKGRWARGSHFYIKQFPACCGTLELFCFYGETPELNSIALQVVQDWANICGYTYMLGILARQPIWEETFKKFPETIVKLSQDRSIRTNNSLQLYKIRTLQLPPIKSPTKEA